MKASKVIAAFMAAGLFLTSTGCTSSKAKQKAAMEEAGINYVYLTVYELTYGCLIRLLGQ